ncbi:uncharacterized protein PITG_22356 [Phytophthora infestans T30-4]|uniref:Uncharacterized protein n=1 Tax=Phytophthora infestans (strain T30-4) TaxID=403677 RepID=D0RM69_PHYIT|nr:uncharacterized protein PITG_22356 [Phytophthora infestans T30-4]EEY59751.1 hypothetical protein PITG_22356 [Phytophthora infestans T30-4]|eukprot:XP_002909861.1 hypothetical protein PITG_22356 [Phytophthora infestans T30-4]
MCCKLARFFFIARDVCSLRPLSLRIFTNPHRTLGDPMALFAAVVTRACLWRLSSLTLTVVTRHERLTVRDAVRTAALLFALHVLMQQPSRTGTTRLDLPEA